MIQIAQGWELSVERGPDWLFVRPRSVADDDGASTPPLAEEIWTLLEQNQARRLVVELDDIQLLHSYLIGQLVKLHKRIATHGGQMRVCGLSVANQDALRMCRLDDRIPSFVNRQDAVRGRRPNQPR